jgi:hypothetical protein
MNNKITNPLLKQLISEIASKANEGRVVDVNWKKLYESKNMVKMEANEKGGEKDPVDDLLSGGPEKNASTPDENKPEKAPTDDKAAAGGDEKKAADTETPSDGGEENAEKAQADATKAKAELEKAKAEKDQAEEELEKQSYIKLKSGSGVQFLLGKLLNQAFKTNTIDALASEMVQKLNIKTVNDVESFEIDNAQAKTLPGMANLIASMKTMATKQAGGGAEAEKPSA